MKKILMIVIMFFITNIITQNYCSAQPEIKVINVAKKVLATNLASKTNLPKTGFGNTWVFMVSLLEWEDKTVATFEKDGRIDSAIINFFLKNGVPSNQILSINDKNANTNTVRSEFIKFLSKAKKEDNLFFYYSGHGYVNEKDKVCFATYKGEDWSAEEIVNTVNKNFAGNQAFFTADCCNSGGLTLEVQKYPKREYVALNSVLPTSLSTGNWTFSNALLYGLQGKNFIDYNNNGSITLEELANYIDKEMAIVEQQKASYYIPNSMKNWEVSKNILKTTNKLVGTHVYVDYDGEDYLGFIEEAGSNNNYKVRFYSYTNHEAEWLKFSRLKPFSCQKDYPIGTKVKALSNYDEKQYKGQIINKFLCLHLVHYNDYDSEWDEWLGPNKIEKLN
jgi:Caspase domain